MADRKRSKGQDTGGGSSPVAGYGDHSAHKSSSRAGRSSPPRRFSGTGQANHHHGQNHHQDWYQPNHGQDRYEPNHERGNGVRELGDFSHKVKNNEANDSDHSRKRKSDDHRSGYPNKERKGNHQGPSNGQLRDIINELFEAFEEDSLEAVRIFLLRIGEQPVSFGKYPILFGLSRDDPYVLAGLEELYDELRKRDSPLKPQVVQIKGRSYVLYDKYKKKPVSHFDDYRMGGKLLKNYVDDQQDKLNRSLKSDPSMAEEVKVKMWKKELETLRKALRMVNAISSINLYLICNERFLGLLIVTVDLHEQPRAKEAIAILKYSIYLYSITPGIGGLRVITGNGDIIFPAVVDFLCSEDIEHETHNGFIDLVFRGKTEFPFKTKLDKMDDLHLCQFSSFLSRTCLHVGDG